MTAGLGLSDDEVQRLREFSGKRGGLKVPVSDCQTMRREFYDGATLEEFEDRFELSTSSVRKHLSGKCSCDGDIDPVSDQTGIPGGWARCGHPYCDTPCKSYKHLQRHYRKAHPGWGPDSQ